MGSRLRRLFGVPVILLAFPCALRPQSPANPKAPPVNPEVISLRLRGVNAVKLAELLPNIATDQSLSLIHI